MMITHPTRKCKYKDGYKYQLVEEYRMNVGIYPPKDIHTEYISLYTNGLLVIRKGYAWDGPSGPTVDTKNFMRGSLEHDALYQLMRMGLLPQKYRKRVDVRLYKTCREDGMSYIRAKWVYWGVRSPIAARSAKPSAKRKVLVAP